MNHQVLDNYNLKFRKVRNGHCKVEANNPDLAIYLTLFNYPEIVQTFLNDVSKALDGNFHDIEDPDWSKELGRNFYMGEINNDLTFRLYYEDHPMQATIYPLKDIREIFNSWLEFITSNG